jgi:hypothetical protein
MTECVAPPGPDDLALAAYNEGEGDQTTVEHLSRCPHCRARATTQAQLHQRLGNLFYRMDCLVSDELQDYHFGLLPAAQMASITVHVQRCPHCTRELATLARFLGSDLLGSDLLGNDVDAWNGIGGSYPTRPGSSVLDRIQTVIARWLQGGLGRPSLALAGLRGADDSQVLYAAGDIQIGIDVQPNSQQPNRRELVGFVLGAESADLPDLSTLPVLSDVGWTAHLWHEDQLVAVAALDELGSFVFGDLAPTEYELIIAGPGITIDVALLPLL